MIGYPYIEQLFYTVLKSSKVIGGRFYMCPKWGSELNNPNIEESLPIGKAATKKYPCAMLMPPPKEGNFEYLGDSKGSGNSLYDLYTIRMLFVATTSSTGYNQPQQPNKIQESAHTISQTWHDMDRVAQNFCTVLRETVQPLGGTVLFWDDTTPRISLITNLGNDDVSGVHLSFRLGLFSGCTIEDYPDDWRTSVVAPAVIDNHPLHSM